ncbi:MAG: HAMP domain-containing histidine kinase [Aphanocapsa sp. GSE-SYN-MK-11-07L]|jgi:signal transduction histidine kinase|nr:HAMP domain-containing histidine kinase [Aphanocapsa sp. GSE-SYN-MK-11-07L]
MKVADAGQSDRLKNLLSPFKTGLRVWGEARTRILIWYVLLMAFFIAVAIPTIRQRLFVHVDARVRGELTEEVAEFQTLFDKEWNKGQGGEIWRELREEDDISNPPSDADKLAALFDIYLERQLTEDDTFLITLVEGEFHKASSRALPKLIAEDSELVQKWGKLSQLMQGEKEVKDPKVGNIIYVAKPIQVNGKIVGVFAAAHTTAGERAEALEAMTTISEVTVVVLCIALVLAWFAAGRVLAPLRLFTTTAQSISESDLTQRITVSGRGEIGELAKTFNEMMDRLESAFETQRNFVNDAGHELRTPITIIRGHLELIGGEPAEQQETLDLVIDELDRMSRFVEDLLLLAKSERPDFLLLETFEVGVLIEELFAKATALADRRWQIDASANVWIVADRQRLTQAMMNLAQNATQHTKPEDIIAIGAAVERDQLRLWVRDTGEGIATADQERIFERFARSANSRRRSQGAGLGLAIVKAITEAHAGKLILQSQLGTGSTFTIVINLRPTRQFPI